MKINIWINKEEVISGNITKYYTTEPVSNLKDPDKFETDYVQVSISKDEFIMLEDNGEWWNNDRDIKDFFNKDIYKQSESFPQADSDSSTHAIYKEFPEYKDMKLGDFQNWFDNLNKDRRKIFGSMQSNVQNNKRKN